MKIYKFYSPTCVPCKSIAQTLEQAIIDRDLEVESIDITQDIDTVLKYQVRSVPTLVNPETGAKLVGVFTPDQLEEWLNG